MVAIQLIFTFCSPFLAAPASISQAAQENSHQKRGVERLLRGFVFVFGVQSCEYEMRGGKRGAGSLAEDERDEMNLWRRNVITVAAGHLAKDTTSRLCH